MRIIAPKLASSLRFTATSAAMDSRQNSLNLNHNKKGGFFKGLGRVVSLGADVAGIGGLGEPL